jgi:O-methyltransferase
MIENPTIEFIGAQAIDTNAAQMNPAAELYLDLLKKVLVNWVYGQFECDSRPPRTRWKLPIWQLLQRNGILLSRTSRFDRKKRENGDDWPPFAHSMIGLRRLDSLHRCIEDVIGAAVPGDFIEVGAWRGGACVLMRGALKAYGDQKRIVWVADSFQGLPKPNKERYPADAGDTFHTFSNLAVSLEEVKNNFDLYDLLDERVRFLKGWFADTLPTAPISRLSILRLDGDMYGSTMEALSSLYPRLSVGGYCIIDDYFMKGCRAAVHDYRNGHSISEPIERIDDQSVLWRRAV